MFLFIMRNHETPCDFMDTFLDKPGAMAAMTGLRRQGLEGCATWTASTGLSPKNGFVDMGVS